MKTIASLCDDILKHLTRLGLQTASSMLPGLPASKVRELTAHLPFVLPDAAVEFYQWSEGLRPMTGVGNDFFPGYGVDSLPEMIEMYEQLSADTEYPRFRFGQQQWFPLFRSGGTDFYAVHCGPAATEDGPIVDDDNEGEHRSGEMPPGTRYVSLRAMLNTLLRAYETGVFYIERGQLTYGVKTYFETGPNKGRLRRVDLTAFEEIAREFNPGVAYWE